MRVMLVSDWTAPRIGGVERQVSDLALRLRAHGHEPRVLTFTPGPSSVDGIPVHRLRAAAPPGWRALQRGLARVGLELGDPMPRATTREIERIVARERIELVHGHALWSSLAHMTVKLAHDRGIPGLLTNHSLIDRAGLLFFRAIGEVFPWGGWPVVLTAVSAAAARDTSLASGRHVRIIPNGLDTTAWAYGGAALAASRPGRSRQHEPRRVVSVTRLNTRKSPQHLLEAFATARGELGGAVRLDLYGDGPLRPSLERRAAALGIADAVTFHGARDANEIATALAAADVFVLPGRREAFGIAAVEALAAGVPVVAMRAGGAAELFPHGAGGLLARDTAELAAHLERVLTDDALRTRMAASAPAQAARFDWDRVTPLYLAAYADARGMV